MASIPVRGSPFLTRWARARASVEGWDVLMAASALMLFAGLALTFSVGVALLVCGVLGLTAGALGPAGAELAAAAARRDGR